MLRNLRIAHPPADPYVRNARLLESIANPAKVRDVAKVSGTHEGDDAAEDLLGPGPLSVGFTGSPAIHNAVSIDEAKDVIKNLDRNCLIQRVSGWKAHIRIEMLGLEKTLVP